MRHDSYDGITDDLITGGLGMPAMLSGRKPAEFADPLHPSFAELRRVNLVRPGAASNGFGRLYGASVDPGTGQPTGGDARLPGDETLAYADDGTGQQHMVMLLQVPKGFRPDRSCLVAIATPGSQNIWVDEQRAGYWGLVHGCAVVWADKGTGASVHDLDSDQVVLTDGQVVPAQQAAGDARLDAITPAERAAFIAAHPHRLAFKWAHAGWTQEAQWGQSVLRAVEFALYEMQQRNWPGGAKVMRSNTKIIATGGSNGGGAVLQAAEQDNNGLLDGVVAAWPQIMTAPTPRVSVVFAGQTHVAPGRTIFDALTYGGLFKPCAALAIPGAPAAAGLTFAANRCQSLAEAGLLHSKTPGDQAAESLNVLHQFGFQREADILIAYSSLSEQGALGQASQYGRFTAADRLCDLSFAAVDKDGRPVPIGAAFLAQIFGRELTGTPDGHVITTINDADPTGPRQSTLSLSRSTNRQDYNFDAARCLRELAVGNSANALRVQAGLRSVLASGNLGRVPTIIVHGRSDHIEPPDFTSRPYVALNSLIAPHPDLLRYIEVLNGLHGDPDPSVAGLSERFIPMTVYQLRALEAMYAHLFQDHPLPPSQVVRTTPPSGRENGHAFVQATDLPPIAARPAAADLITAADGTLRIPQ